MADEKKEVNADFGKKCAFSGVALRKAKRFYRNGLYFRNKAAFKANEAKKAAAAAEKKAEPAAQG